MNLGLQRHRLRWGIRLLLGEHCLGEQCWSEAEADFSRKIPEESGRFLRAPTEYSA